MGEADYLVEVEKLVKRFHVRHEGRTSIKHMVVRMLRPYPHEPFWALKGVTLRVRGGEIVGIVGVNGSGKSTLLRIIAGIYVPTDGQVTVRGDIGSLFELEAGFNVELTGLENIFLSGLLMGYKRDEIRPVLPYMREKSELGDFLDVPVKLYSSGMKFRLGFAIALAFNPQILLVDEVMAAADEAFQRGVYRALEAARDRGAAIMIVSHELEAVRQHCDRVIWLAQGEVLADGPTEDVLERYLSEVVPSQVGDT